jgi:MFS family permease
MIFNACMTIGRFSGDAIIRRFGSLETLMTGGILAAIGLSVGLLSSNLAVALVGFGVVGIGLSVLVPILISMAGNLSGGDRNVAIARASTCGSIGLMTGPAAIGFIAESHSLLVAMMIPVVLLVILSAIAFMMRPSIVMKYRKADVLPTL